MLSKLLNKKIVKVLINPEKTSLKFELENEPSLYLVCEDQGGSSGNDDKSWINHISGIDTLIGQVVNNFRINPLESSHVGGDTELDLNNASLSVVIMTDKGYCDIDFRNENNGYYGGCVYSTSESYNSHDEIKDDF